MYQNIKFLTSVYHLEQCPDDKGTEIAIAGRSNAGKSSLLNVLARQSKLARISKTPGRTQALNFFVFPNQDLRIVDLPGYGYAKTPRKMRQEWGELIHTYLATRKSLQAVIVIMDIRHPLQEQDKQLLDWLDSVDLDSYIVLTKADKISYGQSQSQIQMVKQYLNNKPSIKGIQSFSSLKKTGREQLLSLFDSYLGSVLGNGKI